MKTCYECHKGLTIPEIIAGAAALEVATAVGMEGWVHCRGSDDLFFSEVADKELIKEVEAAVGNEYTVGGSIVVCFKCVMDMADKENIFAEFRGDIKR